MMSRKTILIAWLLSFLTPVLPAWGQAALDAVVRVRAAVPAEAQTAASLGTEREGNVIVIDGQGHVLTIGYLILEADRIEVATTDGKSFPARFVGYDHGTGFGIIKTAPPSR